MSDEKKALQRRIAELEADLEESSRYREKLQGDLETYRAVLSQYIADLGAKLAGFEAEFRVVRAAHEELKAQKGGES